MKRKLFGALAVVAAALTLAGTATAASPAVRPPGDGAIADYPQLMAGWWTWIVETPTPKNPMLGSYGEHTGKCSVNQPGDGVFFLASTFKKPVTRSCVVSRTDHLFFPVANAGYIKFPDETITLAEMRADIACADTSTMTVTLDGIPITDQYLLESTIFEVDVPDKNLFDPQVDALHSDPSIANGYFLLLRPLPPGDHVLRWTSSSPDCNPRVVDVTYRLTVI